jgi:hypothetical protein
LPGEVCSPPARLLPAVETALLGSVEAPLVPLWVWLAIGETPERSTFIGGAIVFAAVAVHRALNESKTRDSGAFVIAVNDDAS